MLQSPFQNALVLTGPTGCGKTSLGIELARRLDAEIISMDSMALYRGMDIGTAKPTATERAQIPHHLIDVLDPSESASVAWWLDQAKRCARDIESRGKQVLFVGGTPLYLKALFAGLFDGPPADEAIRKRLAGEAEAGGAAALHDRLAAVDPACARRIHANDTRRIIRAIEVYELTGKPMSAWQTQWSLAETAPEPPGEGVPCAAWLDLPRTELYERIDRRVHAMFAAGWLEEARQLLARKRPLGREARHALGYKEVFAALDGTIAPSEAIAQVQMRTRNFAKRQITWFRHLPGCMPARKELTWTLWQRKMRR